MANLGLSARVGGETYDVFVSYNWRDHAIVERVAQHLRDSAGLHLFLDRWYLVPGEPWPRALERALVTCRAVAVFVGPGEMGPWQQRERDFTLERQGRSPGFRVIPVLLSGSDPVLGFLGQNTWVDLRQGIDDVESLAILVAAIRGEPPNQTLSQRARSTSARAQPCSPSVLIGACSIFGKRMRRSSLAARRLSINWRRR